MTLERIILHTLIANWHVYNIPCFFQLEGKLSDFTTSGDRKGNRRLERLVTFLWVPRWQL